MWLAAPSSVDEPAFVTWCVAHRELTFAVAAIVFVAVGIKAMKQVAKAAFWVFVAGGLLLIVIFGFYSGLLSF